MRFTLSPERKPRCFVIPAFSSAYLNFSVFYMKKNVRFHFLSKSVILLILLVGASLSGAQAQVFKWATSFGYSPFMDFGNSMAADGTGNSFYAGAFENSLQLGSTTVNSPGKNLFVARFDPAGGVTWVKHFPNNSFLKAPFTISLPMPRATPT